MSFVGVALINRSFVSDLFDRLESGSVFCVSMMDMKQPCRLHSLFVEAVIDRVVIVGAATCKEFVEDNAKSRRCHTVREFGFGREMTLRKR